MAKEKKESDPGNLINGSLNLLGLKIDLGELLTSQENLKERLEELREKLKASGGKEVLSDEEWRRGNIGVTGYIRTRGILGDQEFHVGTIGKPEGKVKAKPATESPEVAEPPVDVFDEGKQVTIVADVPGVSLEDLELKVDGKTFSISTKPAARRSYRKEIHLEANVEPESLKATCRNGALEVHLRKRKSGK